MCVLQSVTKSPWRKLAQRRLMMEAWLCWGARAALALRGKRAKKEHGRKGNEEFPKPCVI